MCSVRPPAFPRRGRPATSSLTTEPGCCATRGRQAATGGPPVQAVSATDAEVLLVLVWGRCTVKADGNRLLLIAEAPTRDGLAHIQAGVGRRVTAIGRRDGLVVDWAPADGQPEEPTGAAATQRCPAFRGVVVVSTIAVVLVIHLGLLATLFQAHWAGWVLAGVAGLVVVKAVVPAPRCHCDHRPSSPAIVATVKGLAINL